VGKESDPWRSQSSWEPVPSPGCTERQERLCSRGTRVGNGGICVIPSCRIRKHPRPGASFPDCHSRDPGSPFPSAPVPAGERSPAERGSDGFPGDSPGPGAGACPGSPACLPTLPALGGTGRAASRVCCCHSLSWQSPARLS